MSEACLEPTCGNVWLICRVCRKLVCLHSAKKIRTDGEDSYFHAECYRTHTSFCDFCGRRHACEELAAAVARIASLERQLHATAEGQRVTLDQVIRVTGERDTLAGLLASADSLLDYVRPILGEAYGERGWVHGLSFDTAVGDACDLIDTRERAASSTSQGDEGHSQKGA